MSLYFRDIIGLEELKERLRKQYNEQKIPHAQLFIGEDGWGALDLALAYARFVNCQSNDGVEACGKCSSCKMYDKLEHPDLHFLFPTLGSDKKESCDDYLFLWRELLLNQSYPLSKDWYQTLQKHKGKTSSNTMIYTKEGAILEEKLALQIAQARYRIVLIYQPDKMHLQLSNKLLKLIEEPPLHTIFLLVGSKKEAILGTILSRLQSFPLRHLQKQELPLFMHRFAWNEKEVASAYHLTNGNVRKMIDLLQGDIEREKNFDSFRRFLRAAIKPDPLELRNLAIHLSEKESKEEQINFLTIMEVYMRELFIVGFQEEELQYHMPQEAQTLHLLSGAISTKEIGKIYFELELARKHIQQNVNSKIVFFDLFLQLTALLKNSFIRKNLR